MCTFLLQVKFLSSEAIINSFFSINRFQIIFTFQIVFLAQRLSILMISSLYTEREKNPMLISIIFSDNPSIGVPYEWRIWNVPDGVSTKMIQVSSTFQTEILIHYQNRANATNF